jgi:hypothetical protein
VEGQVLVSERGGAAAWRPVTAQALHEFPCAHTHMHTHTHATPSQTRRYVHNFIKYEFDFRFDVPATYPAVAPEIELPELEGKTAKMYRGGKICLTIHFKPLWAKNRCARLGVCVRVWLAGRQPLCEPPLCCSCPPPPHTARTLVSRTLCAWAWRPGLRPRCPTWWRRASSRQRCDAGVVAPPPGRGRGSAARSCRQWRLYRVWVHLLKGGGGAAAAEILQPHAIIIMGGGHGHAQTHVATLLRTRTLRTTQCMSARNSI